MLRLSKPVYARTIFTTYMIRICEFQLQQDVNPVAQDVNPVAQDIIPVAQDTTEGNLEITIIGQPSVAAYNPYSKNNSSHCRSYSTIV